MSNIHETVAKLCEIYGITELQKDVWEKLQQSDDEELRNLGFRLRSMLDRQVYMLHMHEDMGKDWSRLCDEANSHKKEAQAWKEKYLGAPEHIHSKVVLENMQLKRKLREAGLSED